MLMPKCVPAPRLPRTGVCSVPLAHDLLQLGLPCSAVRERVVAVCRVKALCAGPTGGAPGYSGGDGAHAPTGRRFLAGGEQV